MFAEKNRIFATRPALPCWRRNSRYGCVSPCDCQRRRNGGSHCMALPPLSAYVGPGAAPREKISHQEKKRMQVQSSQGSCPAAAALLLLLPSTAWHLWGLHWFFCNKIECMEKDSVGLFFGMIFWPQYFTGLTLQQFMISGNFVSIELWLIQPCFFNHFAATIVTGFSETLSLEKNSLSLVRKSSSLEKKFLGFREKWLGF